MEPLIAFADELERRDAGVARRLLEVERLQHEVEELRTHAAAVAAFLASLPAALDARDAAAAAALDARARAETALREAEPEAEHAARDALASAERRVADALDARRALEAEAEARRVDAVRLDARALELSSRLDGVPPAGAGEWASRARGALLVERSGLAREREELVREASELLAGVLGEPMTATSVAGLRDRLERALREESP